MYEREKDPSRPITPPRPWYGSFCGGTGAAGFFLGEPKMRWNAPLPRVPLGFVGAGGRLIRAWRVSMNSSLSVAILAVRMRSRAGEEQFEFLIDFGFSLEKLERCCHAVETVVKCT